MRVLVCALAALVAAGAGATSAATPRTDLRITVWPQGKGAAKPQRSWRLRCEPPRGTVPTPARACRALFANRSALRPPPRDRVCAQIWGGPQVARIVGTVRGARVRATLTRADACEINRWTRLRPLLPVRL